MPTTSRSEKLRRYWDKQSAGYDRKMSLAERKFFAGTREWVCGKASGEVLEVAIGTGLNIGRYPGGVKLTGMDFSPDMLELARVRAAELGRDIELRTGDAQRLEFADASFDTVLCTFGLCAVPDDEQAVAEMVRVLRPGGLLLLADHVVSTSGWVRAIQALIEIVTVRTADEHFRRRPVRHVEAAGLSIEHHDRFKKGIVERVAARKPQRPLEQP
ncbi:MAG: class I SAM-dependent methyltransferase [Stackebrandtia sp.]